MNNNMTDFFSFEVLENLFKEFIQVEKELKQLLDACPSVPQRPEYFSNQEEYDSFLEADLAYKQYFIDTKKEKVSLEQKLKSLELSLIDYLPDKGLFKVKANDQYYVISKGVIKNYNRYSSDKYFSFTPFYEYEKQNLHEE